MTITDSDRREFADRGLIRLERLLPDDVITPVRELCLKVLTREGVWQYDRWCGDLPADWKAANRLSKALKRATKNANQFRALETDDLLNAVHAMVDGRPLGALTNRPQLLMTPPNAGAWTVPHKIWHLDVPRLGALGVPGVQMFSFLDTVAPGGGGTLVIAGSHRLLNDQGHIRSKDVKRRLRKEAYFDALMKPRDADRRHFLETPGRVRDVELQVVELTGEPGDVYLVDLRMLHTLSPNASRTPRLMVTQRYFLQAVLGSVFGGAGDEPIEQPGSEDHA